MKLVNDTLSSILVYKDKLELIFSYLLIYLTGHAVAQLGEVLCYKLEGRGFDSR
jgi:hypothetical protein